MSKRKMEVDGWKLDWPRLDDKKLKMLGPSGKKREASYENGYGDFGFLKFKVRAQFSHPEDTDWLGDRLEGDGSGTNNQDTYHGNGEKTHEVTQGNVNAEHEQYPVGVSARKLEDYNELFNFSISER